MTLSVCLSLLAVHFDMLYVLLASLAAADNTYTRKLRTLDSIQMKSSLLVFLNHALPLLHYEKKILDTAEVAE